MDKITSITQLRELINYVRNLHQGYVTNFYLDETKHATWIETGEFLYDKYEDTVSLLFDHYSPDNKKYFTNLFYISTSIESVIKNLKIYPEMFIYDLYILDIVGKEAMCEPMVNALKAIHAHHDATLVRMNRISEDKELLVIRGYQDKRVVYADETDAKLIEELLHANFDEKLEQLPLHKEITQMIAEKHILKCVVDGKMAGLLLFELNATTLYLRYWLTLPEFRNQGIGGALLKRFFYEGRNTKRQILWVMQNNANAIARYEHYGFVKENMYDYILSYCG